MTTEQIQQGIIDKILLLNNQDLLLAIDTLLGQSVNKDDIYKVSDQQRQVLQASEEATRFQVNQRGKSNLFEIEICDFP